MLSLHLQLKRFSVLAAVVFLIACTPQIEVTTPENLQTATNEPSSLKITISPSPVKATLTPPTKSSEIDTFPLPTKTIISNSRLTVCISEPPIPLNPYTNVYESNIVLEAINDGPVDYVSFQYKPIILGAIPNLESGGLVLQETVVKAGDLVYDPDNKIVQVYEGNETSMPQMVVQFRVRPGIKWSDGVPLTAYDSEYAYKLLSSALTDKAESIRLNQPLAEKLILNTRDYKATDELTIQWIGIPGLVTADYPAYFFSPMPQHLKDTLEAEWPSVGWGAYQIQEWVAGDHILVTKNPFYYRANEGLPQFDEVEFKFIPPTGGKLDACDIVSASIASKIPKEEWEERVQENNLVIISSPGTVGRQLVFNLDDQRDSPIKDKRVRHAISLCLDHQRIANLMGGFVADSSIHPWHPAFTPWEMGDQNSLPNILKEIEIETIQPLSLASLDSDSLSILVEEIVEELIKCGFTVNADLLSRTEFYQPYPDGVVYGSKHDMILFPLSSLDGPACDWLLSANIPSDQSPSGNNIGRFQNAEFDQICKQAHTSMSETEKSLAFEQTQTIWQAYLPSLPLFWYPQIAAQKCHITNFALDPTALELWNIEEIGKSGNCH